MPSSTTPQLTASQPAPNHRPPAKFGSDEDSAVQLWVNLPTGAQDDVAPLPLDHRDALRLLTTDASGALNRPIGDVVSCTGPGHHTPITYGHGSSRPAPSSPCRGTGFDEAGLPADQVFAALDRGRPIEGGQLVVFGPGRPPRRGRRRPAGRNARRAAAGRTARSARRSPTTGLFVMNTRQEIIQTVRTTRPAGSASSPPTSSPPELHVSRSAAPRPGRRRHAQQRRARTASHRRRWVHLQMCMTCGTSAAATTRRPARHRTLPLVVPAAHPALRSRRGLVVLLPRRARLRRRRRTVVGPAMSAGPATARRDADTAAPQIARSAVVIGAARLGEGSLLAEGRRHPLSPGRRGHQHRVGRVGELRRRRHPRDPDDDRAAHHVRASLPGGRGDGRRLVRDRQRLQADAGRPPRRPRLPRRGHPRSSGDDPAERRRRRRPPGPHRPLRFGR